MSATLVALNVGKTVQDGLCTTRILADVSLTLAAGEMVALLGRSGSGKSSLLQILGACDTAFEGEVTVDGVALRGLSDRQLATLRSRTFGFVFQAYNLIPHLSALDNVLLPSFFSGTKGLQDRAKSLLHRVGLAAKTDRLAVHLSGGERQRVSIARAMLLRPRVILCDEPTGSLDAATGEEVIALLDSCQREGATLLVATHDRSLAARAQRVLELEAGQLLAGPGKH